MLYKITTNQDNAEKLEPIAFKDFASFGKSEKELEELVAQNILGVLYEDTSLMPVFQERPYQAEADIYALNEKGD